MKLTIPKHDLQTALRRVQGAISGRPFNPWMACVRLKAVELPASSGSKLHVAASNLDVQISHTTGANVIEAGEALLPFEKLNRHVTGFGPQDVNLSVDGNFKCSFVCGDSKGTLIGMNPTEFAEFPPQERKGFTMPQADLRSAIRKALISVSVDETRFLLNGVLIELQQNKLALVACDGKRLSLVKRLFDGDGIRSVVPTKGAQEALKLLGSDGDVSVLFTSNTAEFLIGATSVVTKLIDGIYPAYSRVLPTEKPHRITLNREELLNAVKSVGWIVDPNKYAWTTFDLSKNKIRVHQVSSTDDAEREILTNYSGPEMTIRLPPEQVEAALGVIDDDEVVLEIVNNITAAVIKAGNFTALIMPHE